MSQPRTPQIAELDTTGVSRILCVVAHPDDVEYGTSTAVAVWRSRGIDVSYLVLTAGEHGIRNGVPEEVARMRSAEQRRACDIVGVEDLVILDYPDGKMEYSLELRRTIARHIRRTRPDLVVVIPLDFTMRDKVNHPDHRVTGEATADAIRDADNPWTYPELLDREGLTPWRAGRLLVARGPEPTHYVDVTGEPLALGIASLAEHTGYLSALPDHPSPAELLTGMTAEYGQLAGVDNAMAFRVYEM